jgi:predicted CXXCH cytochrome family protein
MRVRLPYLLGAVLLPLLLWTASSRAGGADDLELSKRRLREMIHRPSSSLTTRAAPSRGSGSAEPARYHDHSMLICSDCHLMHGADGSANPQLLKRANSLDLCLMCHDGMANVPDVVGPDVNGLSDRSAGFFSGTSSATPNGHNLGPTDTDLCSRCHFGGTPATAQVTCVDCHDPHGNGRPRNLQWASWPEGTPLLGLLIDPLAGGMDRYEASNVAYGTDGTDNLREVTNICIDCHHVFSGSYTDANGDGVYEKHPVTETERGATIPITAGDGSGETDSMHWLDGLGAGFDVPRLRFLANPATNFAAARGVAQDNQVFCLTCHKAHGSSHPFGLIWQNVQPGSGPSGCDQCHNKAG